MTRHHILLCNFAILACFIAIVHSVVLREANFNLLLVKEITNYTVTLSHDTVADEFVFENPEIPTNILIFKFADIIITQLIPEKKAVVFNRLGVTNESYTVVFRRLSYAKLFAECQTIERRTRQNAVASGSVTKISAATATDVPRIECTQDENREKKFRVIIRSNPTFNFEFNFRDVNITNYARSRHEGTETVEIKHRRIPKLYQLQFENVGKKEEFMVFYQVASDPL